MKRFLSMLLAIVMVVSMIPVAASAAEVDSGYATANEDSKYTFLYNPAVDGTLTITIGDGNGAWVSDIMNFDDWSVSNRVEGNAQDSYTYDVVAGGSYSIRIYGPGEPCAAIVDVPYSVVFTPASVEDETITVYGNVIFSGNDVAIAGPQGEGTNYTPAQPVVHTYTPEADGIMTVYIKSASNSWYYSGENLTGHSGKNAAAFEHEVYAGTTYTIQLYAGKNGIADDGVVSYEILFYAKELEAQKEPYIISDTVITENGDHTVTMEALADMTVVTITPAEVGVYTISVPEGTALLNYVGGGSWWIEDWDDTEAAASLEWTCEEVAHTETDTVLDENNNYIDIEREVEGQSMMLGIKSEAETVTINVAKTGEYEAVEVELQVYNNKKFPTKYTLPEGAILGDYININDEVTHTAVKGEDGYYHLDSATGDILLVDMDYQNIVLTDALTGGRGTMYAYVYDENGIMTEKWNIGTACTLYKDNADENGYYPLTDDLIFFYDTYAVGNWVYGTVLDQTEQTNEDVWMYCMRTMKVAELGSLENPIVYATIEEMFADWTNKEVPADETIYFTAPLGGVTLTLESNPGAAALVNKGGIFVFPGAPFTFEGMPAGEMLTIGVQNQNRTGADIVTLVPASNEGTLDNPLMYESVEALVADWTNRSVAGGATVYVVAPLGGVTINISSSPYKATSIVDASGNVMVDAYPTGNFTFDESVKPLLVGIHNDSLDPEAVTLTVVGSDSGSTEVTYVDLVIGNNAVNGEDAHWIYTATADGELTLTPGNAIMGPVSYSFTVNETGPYDMEAGSAVPLVLFAGDVVKIDAVGTGYATLTASWSGEGGEEGEEGEEGNSVLALGDNEVALEADNLNGETWTFTATEDGILTATLTHLKYYVPSYEVEGEFDAYEMSGAQMGSACGRLMQFIVNGNNNFTNQQAVPVEAGDVVTIQLISNYGYRTEGIIALSMAEGGEGGEGGGSTAPEGTIDNPIVITELPYTITVDGTHDDYYTYTSAEACTLKITYPAGNYVSGLSSYEKDEENLYYIATVAAGETVSINPWGNNAGQYVISLTEGTEEPEEPGELGSKSNPIIITEFPSETPVALNENNFEDGLWYQYTATADGAFAAELEGGFVNFFVNGAETYWVDTVSAGDVILMNVGCYWYEEDVNYTLKLYDPAVAKIGDFVYNDLASALFEAMYGDTIVLLADVEQPEIKLIPGVTLDLNGHSLSAEYVSAFKGSNIVDSSEDNAGVLVVDPDCMMISASNAQLPVWNGEGYIFISILRFQEIYGKNADNHTVYQFLPTFETIAHEYLAKGAQNSHVKVVIRMTWELDTANAFQNFVYKDATVAEIVNSYRDNRYNLVFKATILDDKYEGFDLQVLLVSDTGVELALN